VKPAVKRELERVEIPEEHEARERTWAVLQTAFAHRTPVERRPRYVVVAVALAVALAIVGSAFSSPGQAVLDQIREAVGVENAAPALFSLPSPGELLVHSERGVWVARQDGSRRLLGRYREAGWSPFGRYVVAARQNELAALEPDGSVRWTLARPGVRSPRWTGSQTNTRIAYLDRSGIRVVGGDGRGDRLLSPKTGLLAWKPGATFALGSLQGSELRVQDATSGRVLSRSDVGPATDMLDLQWSSDGRRALVVHPTELDVVDLVHRTRQRIPSRGRDFVDAAFAPDGRHIALLRASELSVVDTQRSSARPVRLFAGAGPFSGVTWSPDGRWLLVGWPAADQWVFVRADGKRIRAVSTVSTQFHSRTFPRVEGWTSGP
jgi:hypothetical protein